MVGLNEIRQYINSRIDMVTTVNNLDFKLTNTLEMCDKFCIIFTVDNDSLIFEVRNSMDGFLTVTADKKLSSITRFCKVDSKESFIRTLYILLDKYAKHKDKIRNNGIEQDILNWH